MLDTRWLGYVVVDTMVFDLHRLFHSLSRFFMSVPPAPHIPALFPTIILRSHVKDWSANIRALPDASLCIVESIELKKAIESKQHEYLLVRVRHPNSTRFAIFIVDRCPSSKISIRRLISSQSKYSEFSSPYSPPAALDTVAISPDGDESKLTVDQHGPAETLSTLTFPILHPTVLDLSTLLEVVNSHAPFYTVDEYQCYWYAGAAFEVIMLEFNATETVNTSTKLERASYKGYPLKKEDTTPTLRKEFTARRDLYAKEREDQQTARDAPLVAVCSCHFLMWFFS